MKNSAYLMIYLIAALLTGNSFLHASESKRIEVYAISQSFWDVRPGESLSEIVIQLLPEYPAMRKTLMHDIVDMNPSAFIQGDPNQLRAHSRIWLPDHINMLRKRKNANTYHIQSFDWGQVYTPKRN